MCGLSAGSCAGSRRPAGFHGTSSTVTAWACCPARTRPLRRGGEPAAGLPPRGGGGMPCGYAVDDGAALHFVGARSPAWCRRGRTRGRIASRSSAGSRRDPPAIGYLGAPERRRAGPCGLTGARRAGRPDHPRDGRRRLHAGDEEPGARPLVRRSPGARAADLPAAHRRRRLRGPDPALPRELRRPLCEPSHVSLFRLGEDPMPLEERLLGQDAIYVGGGSMVNLLAIWRAQGLPRSCARRGGRGSCSPASAPARCAGSITA